jgi:predicted ATPase/class 3 adenylate cyclase
MGERGAAAVEALRRLAPKGYAERLLATRGQVGKERRVVTMLFSDVKGSTTMAEQMDPEDWAEIMDGAFEFLIEPIYRYEGTLARLMGDAILAFFGAPIAHEDDPERACRAGLEIVEGVQGYASKLGQERGLSGFNVRVGINTGLVVVGEAGSDLRVEYAAMGDAINLAQRMESAAQAGTVLITEDTHKLIAPLFETEALGRIQVKGRSQPVSTYRLLAVKEVSGKARGIAGLESPLVGREAEFAALQEAVVRLQGGVGGIVTVVGEAGVGKSRLVAELRKQAPPDVQWVEGRCLSYGTSIAYLLWLDVLRDLLSVRAEDPPQAVRETLQERVQALCAEHFDDAYPCLARLMSLPLEAQHEAALRGLEGPKLKAVTFQAVETLIECAARERPVVLVCEDLHWADPTSTELLDQLLGLTDRAPLLVLCVFRPERGHGSWQIRETAAGTYRDHHTDLWLKPLSSAESETLVDNLLRAEDMPSGFHERILRVAEGNPFYVEEVIRSLIDNGAIILDRDSGRWRATLDVADIAIPDTLNGVLMARIDRLQEEAKRVLQMASVIGRIFLYRVLAAIAEEERKLDARLLMLQREEMIRERARMPELEYIFKHELTRQAAYNSLLKKARRTFHGEVAEALERLFPDRIEEQVELLAYHWHGAGVLGKAVPYMLQAGEKAARQSAYQEAVAHYTSALELLGSMPESVERAQQELGVQLGLGMSFTFLKGWGAPEVSQAYARARVLCREMGDPPQMFPVLAGLVGFYDVRGELDTAREIAARLPSLAEQAGDPLLKAAADAVMGYVALHRGELEQAQAHLERMIAFYDPRRHHDALASIAGNDPGVTSLMWSSWVLWLLGYPQRALKRSEQAIDLADEQGQPFNLAFAQGIAGGFLHQFLREPQQAQTWAQQCLDLSTEYGFAMISAPTPCLEGWTLAISGQPAKAVPKMQQGVAAFQATGAATMAPQLFALLAEAHAKVGEMEEAHIVLDQALALVQKHSERYYEAEIHRVKGELLQQQGQETQAEASFRKAIQVARQQRAKSWELRATMSLCRLLQVQGKREEARQLLSEIYGWFTEGFDTPDLKDAKALLEELS